MSEMQLLQPAAGEERRSRIYQKWSAHARAYNDLKLKLGLSQTITLLRSKIPAGERGKSFSP